MDDRAWFERIVKSLEDTSLGLPGFPSTYQQEVFVGKSNVDALTEAFTFYQIVKRPPLRLKPASTVLDFGAGWGRIIRFFTKDVDAANLYGVDVDGAILDEARALRVPGRLSQIHADERLPFDDGFFDVIYGFSVFSHLSTRSASFWLAELMRVLKPGGRMVVTTTTNRFLDLCHACFLKEHDRNRYEEMYAKMFSDPADAKARYAAGEHVYAPVPGNAAVLDADHYGWAAMPPAFVKREIGHLAESIAFEDDANLLEQGFFTITKTRATLGEKWRAMRAGSR